MRVFRGARVLTALVAALMVAGAGLGLCACSLQQGGSGSDAQQATSSSGSQQSKSTLDAYSWDELSQISASIASASTADDRTQIARDAGLVDDQGNIIDQTNQVQLTNGYVIDVRIIGIGHDTTEDGGVAGLTFMTVGALGRSSMNDTDSVAGGWEASALRAKLTADYLPLLPDELTQRIVPVQKLTNNRGHLDDVSSVTATTDTLWLLSARELCGQISWEQAEYGDTAFGMDNTLNAEGTQYQYFQQLGIDPMNANQSLTLDASTGKSSWWLRTPFPALMRKDTSEVYFYRVSDVGNPHSYVAPTSDSAVVVCFCV